MLPVNELGWKTQPFLGQVPALLYVGEFGGLRD